MARRRRGVRGRALERHGVAIPLVPPRYRSGYFAHIFSGRLRRRLLLLPVERGAGRRHGRLVPRAGGLTRENGDVFRARLLSVGGTVDPIEAFTAVRGRGPSTEPLLRRRGLRG